MSFFASISFVNFSTICIATGGFSKILDVELVYCTMCQALLKMRIWNRLKCQKVWNKTNLVMSKKTATKNKRYFFRILQQAPYHLLLCYCFCKLHFFKLYFSDEGGWSGNTDCSTSRHRTAFDQTVANLPVYINLSREWYADRGSCATYWLSCSVFKLNTLWFVLKLRKYIITGNFGYVRKKLAKWPRKAYSSQILYLSKSTKITLERFFGGNAVY